MPTLLTPDGLEFVRERHLAVLSTHGKGEAIHAVAVGFTLADGILRITTTDHSQKVRNIERNPHSTVTQVDGRRWLSLSGEAQIVRDPDEIALAVELYGQRYRTLEFKETRIVIRMPVATVMSSAGLRV